MKNDMTCLYLFNIIGTRKIKCHFVQLIHYVPGTDGTNTHHYIYASTHTVMNTKIISYYIKVIVLPLYTAMPCMIVPQQCSMCTAIQAPPPPPPPPHQALPLWIIRC